jgi:hypothetical protein
MDTPNAFVGRKSEPATAEVVAALGTSVELWNQLVDWLAEQGAADQEWKSSGAKYGWSLRLKVKKRNIIYLSPCAGCFRVALILGDKAVTAARGGDLSKSTLKLLDESPRYPEGTGVRLIVKAQKDLAAIKKLALIKMAN